MRNVKPKKHLGQHFLKDISIAEKITNLLTLQSTKNVLEIGPGMGILTHLLAKKDIELKAIEIDLDSVDYLIKKYPNMKEKIILGDFLNLKLEDLFNSPFSLIGNFPYKISSEILFNLLKNRDIIPEMVGMFQKEVAERIVAKNGKKRGAISILLQAFYETEYCLTVEETSFNPPPKVKSGVIRLKRNERQTLTCGIKLFENLVKTGFNQKRKKLRNALKTFTFENKIEITELLEKRAEQLSVEEFEKLASYVR